MADWSRKRKVVVSDDDPLIRLVLRGALEQDGFIVVEAEDGATAAEHARNPDVCAAIVDARMPGLTLTQTMSTLRANRTDIPVLILSGKLDAPPEADDPNTLFLSKPVDAHILLETVRSLVERECDHDG